MLRVLDLFSGIGGFSLGLERTGGFETVAFCEIEEFPRKVLAKHWPGVPIYNDVRTLTADVLRRDGIAVDVITGGFPCQDLSVAGKRAGLEGERSGLWSEIVRLTRELSPRYVIVENVANLLSGPSEKRGGWFGRVLGDLAECGYDAEWENIPASALGAPHRRERIWIVGWPAVGRDVANADEGAEGWPADAGLHAVSEARGKGLAERRDDVANPSQLQRNGGDHHAGKRMEWGPLSQLGNGGWQKHLAHAAGIGQPGQGQPFIASNCATSAEGQAVDAVSGRIGSEWRTEPDVGRVADGVPARAHRLAALGNAVVPQIPELIGRAILQAEAAE